MKTKRTRGVFADIVPNATRRAAWDTLLSMISEHGLDAKIIKAQVKEVKEFRKLMAQYKGYVDTAEAQGVIQKLSKMESRMLQLHCLFDFRLSYGTLTQTKNGEQSVSVIARAPFHLPDQKRQELRIYLGRLSDYKGKSLEQLKKDQKFIKEAEGKMLKLMLDTIKSNA